MEHKPTSKEAKIAYWKEMARAFEDSDTRRAFQVADLTDQVVALSEDLEAAERLIAYLRNQLKTKRAA